jgi:hypothetical protein
MAWRARSVVALLVALVTALPARAGAQATGEAVDSGVATNPWSLRLSADLGAGTRDIDVPMDGIVYRIRPGHFAAVGLGFELDHAVSQAVTLGLLVRYQSSIGHGIVERHTDGSVHPLDARAHRLELGFAPTFAFDSARTWALAAAAGYGLLNFRPEAHHLVTPAYSLAGPHLRAALQFAPWDGLIRLSLGPEVQWIVHVGQDLRDRGMAASGLGAGGEAALELRLGRQFTIGATYRELRSFLDSSQAQRFVDVARFITARLSGTL